MELSNRFLLFIFFLDVVLSSVISYIAYSSHHLMLMSICISISLGFSSLFSLVREYVQFTKGGQKKWTAFLREKDVKVWFFYINASLLVILLASSIDSNDSINYFLLFPILCFSVLIFFFFCASLFFN